MTWRLVAAIALIGATAGCGGDTTDPGSTEAAFPADYLASFTQVRDCRFSVEHDGVFITVHANDVANDAYVNGVYPLPEGSMLVKTLYDDPECSQLAGYAVMVKMQDGYESGAGDWYWESVDAGRSVEQGGRLQSCLSCHVGCTDGRDFTCTDP